MCKQIQCMSIFTMSLKIFILTKHHYIFIHLLTTCLWQRIHEYINAKNKNFGWYCLMKDRILMSGFKNTQLYSEIERKKGEKKVTCQITLMSLSKNCKSIYKEKWTQVIQGFTNELMCLNLHTHETAIQKYIWYRERCIKQ